MFIYYVLGCLAGIVFGTILCRYLIRRPIYIRFEHSFLIWSEPVLVCFVCIIVSFFFDLLFGSIAADALSIYSNTTGNTLNISGWVIFFILKALENGFLIPIFVHISSLVFGRIVKKLGLIYLYTYSENVPKSCFTLLTLLLTCRLLMFMEWDGDIEEIGFVIVRIMMWWMTIYGTWRGFGFGCNVTFEEDDKNPEEKKEREKIIIRLKNWVDRKKNIIVLKLKKISNIFKGVVKSIESKDVRYKEVRPIIESICVCLVVLCFPMVSENEKSFWVILLFVVFFGLTMIMGLIWMMEFYILDEERSIEQFDKRIAKFKSKQNKRVSGRFGRMKYHIDNNAFTIDEVNIKYSGPRNSDYVKYFSHEEHLFKGTRKFKKSDTDEIKKYLLERREKQEKMIDDGFKSCREVLKKRKMEQMKKLN